MYLDTSILYISRCITKNVNLEMPNDLQFGTEEVFDTVKMDMAE
jgi:hypothetical protein